MPDEIDGVKFSEFSSETPNNADEVVGLHSGNNARFSVANFVLAVRQGLANLFVPVTRKVNNKALSADIALDASDVGAVDADDVGVAGGVAELDENGKVPTSQLPTMPSAVEANPAGTATDTLVKLKVDNTIYSVSEGADEATIAPVEASTTASEAHPLGSIFYLNGVLYRALADIAIGGTINTGTGGNATQTTIAANFSRVVKLTSAQYAQLSAAEKAADIVYISTDDNVIAAEDVTYDNTASGASATTAQGALDEAFADISAKVPVYGLGENLLDNAYFLNPVNQRGQSSYSTAAAYCLDRWALQAGSITVSASGVKLNASSRIAQSVENGRTVLDGKTITFSALVTGVTGRVRIRIASGTTPKGNATGLVAGDWITTSGMIKLTAILPAVASGQNYNFILDVDANSEATWEYAKLELGTEQTLAHLEGSTWVLNEIPDYEEELIKCQISTADSSDTYANKSLATEQQLAYVESGTTASRAYAMGEWFCRGGKSLRAKTAIAQGATFTEGTNCVEKTSGSLLKAFISHIFSSGAHTLQLEAGVYLVVVKPFGYTTSYGVYIVTYSVGVGEHSVLTVASAGSLPTLTLSSSGALTFTTSAVATEVSLINFINARL